MALAVPIIHVSMESHAQHAGIDDPDLHDAVILLYHRFGEDKIPSTNIRLEQFDQQLAELEAGDFKVLPLQTIVDAFRTGTPLPPKAIAITIDDAYRSFKTEGWPRLKKKGYPATLFVATDPVDQGHSGYLDWDEIRALAADGVTIGHHSAGHIHMADEGYEATRADILRANDRFKAELGHVPELFAWPYGEYSTELVSMAKELGFKAAMAQYSSVAASWSNQFALPRFPFNERYSTMDRFQLIASARALPVKETVPTGPVITTNSANPPAYGFTLDSAIPGIAALACYPNHTGAAKLSFLDGNRIEVRVDKPFPMGRNRINCTLPGPDRRWYWLGKFFYIPGNPD